MPSGARKRKAAKKKKEIQPNYDNPNPSASIQTQGNGDDESGEISSPASQDHHHNTFSGGEEEKVDESVVQVDRELSDNKKDGKKSEHEEIATKSYDGGLSRSSSSNTSSSDDESHEKIPSVVVQEKIDISSQADIPSLLVQENIPSVVQEDNAVGVSEAFEDESSQQEQNEIIQSVQNVDKVFDTTESVQQEETDDRLSVSYNAPVAFADNGADIETKDSGVTEPLLVPARNPEPTSWKSCCGLFDVFTGSGR